MFNKGSITGPNDLGFKQNEAVIIPIPPEPPVVIEPETILFFAAADILDDNTIYNVGTAQERTGANFWDYVDDELKILKDGLGLARGINNLSTRIDAIYLMLGGTATRHKFNFCNPVDTNPGFRGSFFGGWIHSGTGAKPNGVNAYMNTHFNSVINATLNRMAFGIYSRTNDSTGSQVYGAQSFITGFIQNNLSSANMLIGNLGTEINYVSNPTTRFLFCRRTAANFAQAYRDGGSLGTNLGVSVNLANSEFCLGARNNEINVQTLYSGHEIAFSIITGITPITDIEAGVIRTFCDNLQLKLGRNV